MARYHWKPYGLYNRIDFGTRHRDEYVKDVIAEDPDYIAWCLDNIKNFRLTEEAMIEFEEAD